MTKSPALGVPPLKVDMLAEMVGGALELRGDGGEGGLGGSDRL